jgi:predicted enzyme related to lactoylglutathione lyase
MGQPVVHFEIIGKDPARLRDFFGELFGWEFDTSGTVSESVSEPTNYGFLDRLPTDADGNGGIPGGVGGGSAYDSHAVVYVGVPDVEAALQQAERLGATRAMDPARAPSGLVVGQFRDPEGTLIGLAAA